MVTPNDISALYQILYEERVLKEDVPRLASSARVLIKRAIEERLMTHPIHYGKPLRYNLHGQRRLRVGDYRILYTVDEERKQVVVLAIQHRSRVYDP